MGRGRALVSSFPREILKNQLGNEKIKEFLRRHKMLDKMRQWLLTLAAVADDAEAKLLLTADRSATATSSVADWLCHLHDVTCRLRDALNETDLGDAELASIDFILARFGVVTKQKSLLMWTAERPTERDHRNLNVYGRDREKDELIELLLSDRPDGGYASVIAVVGVDGIGKTTLAELVYHDDRVKASFDLRGWAEFQEGLDAESLARITLDSFGRDFHYGDGLTELMRRLRECLSGKKFLLVLDGCSQKILGWETLLGACLADAAGRGSAVIVTTPRVEVASEMLSDCVLHLGLLSLQDSCSLFSDHAFGDKKDSPSELASVTRQMLRKLGGLPLAVKKVANLLYDHRDFHVWTKLLKMKRSDLLDLDCNLLPLRLPSCLYRFEYLVRLEIIGSGILELPTEIGELACLRHLDLSFSGIRTLPDSISAVSRLQTLNLSFCRYLLSLPGNLVHLVHLHYLDIRGTSLQEMPLQFGRLKNLRTLMGFIVNNNMESGSSTLEELASVLYIRTLSITATGLQHMVDATRASEANLKEKTSLENFALRWNKMLVAECKQEAQDQLKKLEQALEHLEPPKQVKTIEFSGCPVSRFPYWLGDASFNTLEALRLHDCNICCFLPPLGQLPSLKELYIQGCDNIRLVGKEFYGETTSHYVPFKSLEILWFVDMPYWKEWIHLDNESLQFPCLRELYLIHCPELLQDLPKHLPCIKRLEISECNRLVASHPKILPDNHELVAQEQACNETPPASVAQATSESSSKDATSEGENTTIIADEFISDDSDDDHGEELHFREMLDFKNSFGRVDDPSELVSLPKGLKSLTIERCHFLEFLPNWLLSESPDILELLFINCSSLKDFADVLKSDSLRTLYIHRCPNLELRIPLGIHKNFALLQHLCISSSCKSLTSIAINIFPALRTLYIKDCPDLGSFLIAEGIRNHNLKLESFEIQDCPNLTSFPHKGLPTPKLKSISISNCRSLNSLPDNLATLTSLESLLIDKCPELESFPDGGLPPSLSLLSISFSDKLAPQKEWKLHMLHSLTHFEIEGGCIGMKAFPDKLLLPRNLKSLRISSLSDLALLNGRGLQHLTSLETLEIYYCDRLFSLPKEGLPSSLTCLSIKGSSILTHKLSYRSGAEWSKIADIPNIQIDDSAVYGAENGETRGQKQNVEEKKFVVRPTDLEAMLKGEKDESDEKSHIIQELNLEDECCTAYLKPILDDDEVKTVGSDVSGVVVREKNKRVMKRVAVRTKSEVDIVDDGFKWKQYGRQMFNDNPNPRKYYRCSVEGCPVKKRVERDKDDLNYLITTYEGTHTHDSPKPLENDDVFFLTPYSSKFSFK